MRTFALSLLILIIGITAATAKRGQGGRRGRKGRLDFFKGFDGQEGGKGHCKDPSKMFAKIFGMICDVENCTENAPKCMDAIKLPGDLCEYVRECKHRHRIHDGMEDDTDGDAEEDAIFVDDEEGEDSGEDSDSDSSSSSSSESDEHRHRRPKNKKKMMACILKTAMESVGLVYVPDDYSSNLLALLKVTVNDNTEITDATKSNMLSAIYDETCYLPTEMMKMEETLRFNICLMKTCVKSMVPQ